MNRNSLGPRNPWPGLQGHPPLEFFPPSHPSVGPDAHCEVSATPTWNCFPTVLHAWAASPGRQETLPQPRLGGSNPD